MDREKVIKGIDICLQRFHCGEYCPYYNYEKIGCMEQLREDALALLKEQEAVKLHTIDTDEEQYSFWFVCGNCGWKIYKVVDDENCEDRKQIYFCASCGRPISWEGR